MFIASTGLVEVVLSAMSVEKTTTTLLKHQVLSLVQLVVYVVYEEAIAMGQATSANLLLITELSEALMWRLAGTAATSAASGLQYTSCPGHSAWVCMRCYACVTSVAEL